MIRDVLGAALAGFLCACRNEASAEDEHDDEGAMCAAQECEHSADCVGAACVWMDPGPNDCAPPAGDEGGSCPCVRACAQCLPIGGLGCVDDQGCCEGICALADAVPGEAACVPAS